MPTAQETGDFCYGFARDADGAITFRCSDDAEKWPWLNLHPADNIAVQSTNYFALSGVSLFAGSMDGSKWSALTKFHWRAYQTCEGARHPAGGRATQEEDGIGYACSFADADGRPVYDVSGEGVVFKTRDFEGWRAKAKAKILALPEPAEFVFAEPAAAGVKTQSEVFVTALADSDAGPFADALMTAESAFRPAHPYHGGSGDHVNSGNLCDAVQQTAHLVRGPGYASRGSAVFSRYVELGRPFRIQLLSDVANKNQLKFAVEQAGVNCAEIEFGFDDE